MERIFVLIGIINQLSTTRLNRVLQQLELPMAQFSLLTHFSHHPQRGWTVTQLARVMEMNQPAMTKTTQRLFSKRLLRVTKNQSDKRVKTYYVTSKGLAVLERAWQILAPSVAELSKDWKSEELDLLQRLLEQLKNQLDEGRE